MNVSSLQIDHEVLKKRCKEVEIESSMKIKEEDVRRRIEEIRRYDIVVKHCKRSYIDFVYV